MSEHGTEIQWTHIPGYKGETWNPVTGCDRVSPGCAHCYALEFAARLKVMGSDRYQKDGDPQTSGPGFGLTLHHDKVSEPLHWRKPRAIFVNSMSDLFHEEIPDSFIDQVFYTMGLTQRHLYLVLTKRPERMLAYLRDRRWRNFGFSPAEEGDMWFPIIPGEHREGDAPLPNVWLGVTIENRRFVDRADLLRETPAAVRFISAEPLLGPLVPTDIDGDALDEEYRDGTREDPEQYEACKYCGNEAAYRMGDDGYCISCPEPAALDLTDIDWLITGGESGSQHRRFDPQWALDLQHECELNSTAFFHKQNGGLRSKAGGRLLDGREYNEFPALPSEVPA